MFVIKTDCLSIYVRPRIYSAMWAAICGQRYVYRNGECVCMSVFFPVVCPWVHFPPPTPLSFLCTVLAVSFSLPLSILLSRHLHLLALLSLSLYVFFTPAPPFTHAHTCTSPRLSSSLRFTLSLLPSPHSLFLSNFLYQGNNMLQSFQMETESVAPIRTAPDLLSKQQRCWHTHTCTHTHVGHTSVTVKCAHTHRNTYWEGKLSYMWTRKKKKNHLKKLKCRADSSTEGERWNKLSERKTCSRLEEKDGREGAVGKANRNREKACWRGEYKEK